ncbi:hypothetical protein HID58_074235 [Brassica napus]|uniref:BED-type domain-containing protein n=1 Tax=Brassica napus TaxID=3708 RepID=A0ABQ7YG63_BRANA|nr:hypothetical protein HID58_074235 [Brassica napus]
MGSRGDSGDQFTFDTSYTPPNTLDFETQQVMARLATADEIASQVADEGVNAGEKQRSKRKHISLVDSEEDSDVEITPTTQTMNPRRQTSFGTASQKPMILSTLKVGSGSSKQACSQKKYVPAKSVTRGGRRNKGLSKGSGSQSQKKIEEEIPELEDELDEEALDEDELGEEEREETQRSDVWKYFTVVRKPNGMMKAACNHCKREYAWQSHSHGTSGLRRHHPPVPITRACLCRVYMTSRIDMKLDM